jgi:hypothetical protein
MAAKKMHKKQGKRRSGKKLAGKKMGSVLNLRKAGGDPSSFQFGAS